MLPRIVIDKINTDLKKHTGKTLMREPKDHEGVRIWVDWAGRCAWGLIGVSFNLHKNGEVTPEKDACIWQVHYLLMAFFDAWQEQEKTENS